MTRAVPLWLSLLSTCLVAALASAATARLAGGQELLDAPRNSATPPRSIEASVTSGVTTTASSPSPGATAVPVPPSPGVPGAAAPLVSVQTSKAPPPSAEDVAALSARLSKLEAALHAERAEQQRRSADIAQALAPRAAPEPRDWRAQAMEAFVPAHRQFIAGDCGSAMPGLVEAAKVDRTFGEPMRDIAMCHKLAGRGDAACSAIKEFVRRNRVTPEQSTSYLTKFCD